MARDRWPALARGALAAWVAVSGVGSAGACREPPGATIDSSSEGEPDPTSTSSATASADSGSTGASETSGTASSEGSSSSGGAPGDVCEVEPPAVDEALMVLVQTLCLRKGACDCRGYDLATCVLDARDLVLPFWDAAVAVGLEYDAECVAERAAWIRGLSCERDGDEACALGGCKPFHGSAGRGEPCESILGRVADDCAQGLFCNGGQCSPDADLPTVGLGEPCYDSDEFRAIARCDRGLECDSFGTDVCFDAPGLGEPCEQGDCELGLWCDEEDDDGPVCRAQLHEGEACRENGECDSFDCILGVCAAVEGAPCILRL